MKLLAFHGKKQSGKDTSVKIILGEVLKRIYNLPYYYVNSEQGNPHYGELFVPALVNGETLDCVFNVKAGNQNPQVAANIKIYSFADELKNTVCMKLLGLTHEQCWGTDEQKNTPTKYKWEDMPCVITDYNFWFHTNDEYTKNLVYHEPGVMSAREVMQFVGTKLFRKMYSNVWVDATINNVLGDASQIALINDCRFPNEGDAIQAAGGKVIKLRRNEDSSDKDESETAMDNWGKFDWVMDNRNMTIDEQGAALLEKLIEWGWE